MSSNEKFYAEQGYVSLHTLVKDLIADQRLTTMWRYVWYLHYMIGGYRRLSMTTIPLTKQMFLKMPKNKMISWPVDFLGLIRMGVQSGDRIVPMDEDNSIHRVDENDKRYIAYESLPRAVYRAYELNDWINRDAYLMGTGNNRIGYYTVNHQKKRFEFSVDSIVNTGQNVYIEYVADGCGDMSTETMVYAPIAETLKAWAVYRWAYFKWGAADRRTEAERIQYLRELNEYKAMTSNLSANSIIAALQKTQSVTPKW